MKRFSEVSLGLAVSVSAGVASKDECKCTGGTVSTDADHNFCNNWNVESCSECDDGYYPVIDSIEVMATTEVEFMTCEKNVCSCKHGTPASHEKYTPVPGICPASDVSSVCVSYRKRQEEKKNRPFCSQHATETCESCDPGYEMNAENVCDPIPCEEGFHPEFEEIEYPNSENVLHRRSCLPNVCTCQGGKPSPFQKCPGHNKEKCESCDAGYELAGDNCVKKENPCDEGYYLGLDDDMKPCCNPIVCDCPNGSPLQSFGSLICPDPTAVHCMSCESGYLLTEDNTCIENPCSLGERLENDTCVKNECLCDNGIAKGEDILVGGVPISTTCLNDGDHQCARCHEGFKLSSQGKCVKNRCECAGGIAAEYCEIDGQHKCAQCFSPAILVAATGKCERNVCEDNLSYCDLFVSLGYCMKSGWAAAFMDRNCKKSCDLCEPTDLAIDRFGPEVLNSICGVQTSQGNIQAHRRCIKDSSPLSRTACREFCAADSNCKAYATKARQDVTPQLWGCQFVTDGDCPMGWTAKDGNKTGTVVPLEQSTPPRRNPNSCFIKKDQQVETLSRGNLIVV